MDFNPILTEIQSHMAAMSPAAQAAVKMANPSLPSPDATGAVNSPSVLPPGTLLPHPASEPPPGNITMPNSAPPLMPSAQPGVTAPRGTVAGETNEMGRLLHTGSGISQIGSKIENSRLGEAHPFLGKLLGGLAQGAATVGDIGLSAVAPEIAINTPGTAYHHQALVNQEGRQVNAATENAQKQASTEATNAEIPLREAETAGREQQNAANEPVEITPEQAQSLGMPELVGEKVSPAIMARLSGQHQGNVTKEDTTGQTVAGHKDVANINANAKENN